MTALHMDKPLASALTRSLRPLLRKDNPFDLADIRRQNDTAVLLAWDRFHSIRTKRTFLLKLRTGDDQKLPEIRANRGPFLESFGAKHPSKVLRSDRSGTTRASKSEQCQVQLKASTKLHHEFNLSWHSSFRILESQPKQPLILCHLKACDNGQRKKDAHNIC
jgi:hypothetical protein